MKREEPSGASADLAVGTTIGTYEIDRVVGIGGMGTVYEAHHLVLGRRVAIKVLHHSVNNPEMIDRLVDEGRAASNLGHPHIVECTDLGSLDDGRPYLVMEFLDGVTLATEVEEHGMLPIARACNIAMQVASALEATHAAGIIHRDLKSDNVFLLPRVDGGDEVKVIDFGISKFEASRGATRPGTILGTADFMPPEQVIDPSAIDSRADIYALGVLMYQMLAGRLPFQDVEFPLVLSKIVNDVPQRIHEFRPNVPDAVVAVAERAMERDPSLRFPTAAAFALSLRRALPDQTWLTPTPRVARAQTPAGTRAATQPMRRVSPSPSSVSAQPKAKSKRKLVVGIGLVSAVAIAAGVGFAMSRGGGESKPVVATAAAKAKLSIESNAPNAEIVFRGEVYPLPYRAEIAAGNARELVEVRAAGYVHRQFWISVESTVNLVAELAPIPADSLDAGLTDAALVASNDGVGPGLLDAGITKPGTTRPGTTKPGTTRPGTTKPDTTKPDTTRPGTTKPDTTKPDTTKPDTTKPDTTKPDTTKPDMTKPDTTKPGLKPGTVDAAGVRAVVNQHLGGVRSCFDRGRMEDPQLAGRVVMIIALTPLGEVGDARVGSTELHSATTETCLIKLVRGLQFPAPAGQVAATISYPFVFK